MITKNDVKKTENATVEKQKSNVPDSFKRWANDLRELQSIREKRTGRGGVGGGARWWLLLPDQLKEFLLFRVAPDDFGRYIGVTWASLPDGLRSALASECREVGRAVSGCPWR